MQLVHELITVGTWLAIFMEGGIFLPNSLPTNIPYFIIFQCVFPQYCIPDTETYSIVGVELQAPSGLYVVTPTHLPLPSHVCIWSEP